MSRNKSETYPENRGPSFCNNGKQNKGSLYLEKNAAKNKQRFGTGTVYFGLEMLQR